MITKAQATDPNNRAFHSRFGDRCLNWWRNGKTQTWKSAPRLNEFRIPVKYGLYSYGAINHNNADEFHLASECPHAWW